MKMLVACEYSGIVRTAFEKKGWDAWSCDLLPTEIPGKHYQGDVMDIINEDWDLMIAHPPCTHLSVSGARWFTEGEKDIQLRNDALKFVKKLMSVDIKYYCIENPVSVISSHIRKSDQVIHPYLFGHPERKTTCLWLKNLPKLQTTHNVYNEMVLLPIKIQNRLHWLGSGHGKERSKTFQGIADAMAKQWGEYITNLTDRSNDEQN